MLTTAKIKEYLEQGINVVLSPDSDFIILCADGSARNNHDQLVMPADSYRAFLYKNAAEKAASGPIINLGTPAAASATAVHAAITGSDSAPVVVTTDITSPDVPRNLTVTPGGTTGDVAAGSVVIEGTDAHDNAISEAFTFLADATGAKTGTKAFKTVTKITIPVQDGGAATFAIGTGAKLGLPFMCEATAEILLGILGTTITAHNPAVSTPPSVAGTTIDMSAGTYNGSKAAIVLVNL